MNKVRLVAVVAASVGVAMFAGTLFQPEQAPTAAQPAPIEQSALPAPTIVPTPDAIGTVAIAGTSAIEPAETPVAADMFLPASLLPAIPEPQPTEPSVGGLVANLQDSRPQIDGALQAELDACAVWLVVSPEPGAMLETSVYAPCDAGAAVEIVHGGLSFDTTLGADGQLLLSLPAMADLAEVTLTFADGRSVTDSTMTPGFVEYERVVLQWTGAPVWALNAFEFGALPGSAGHVRPDAPRAAGILTALGDPALDMARMAMVYTLPPASSVAGGDVALDIEVAITAQSCGQQMQADLLHVRPDAAVRRNQIVLDMPQCDGSDGFVVLNNLMAGMTLALN